ncbi:MAG: DNA gyrase inhibitor YacG [Gallionella sp.]|nr:DNA gyrase inhibitor YacG [Gallionella sp.]
MVTCPQCGTEHVWNSHNLSRPFCSERCKLIDLGKWANEEYRVEQPETAEEFITKPD